MFCIINNSLMLLVCLHGDLKSKYNFVETARKFTIAKLSIGKVGSSSVALAVMKIRAYGSKALRL